VHVCSTTIVAWNCPTCCGCGELGAGWLQLCLRLQRSWHSTARGVAFSVLHHCGACNAATTSTVRHRHCVLQAPAFRMCRCRYSNTLLAQVRHAHAGAVRAHEVRVVPAQLITLPRLLCLLHGQAQVNMCRLVRVQQWHLRKLSALAVAYQPSKRYCALAGRCHSLMCPCSFCPVRARAATADHDSAHGCSCRGHFASL
jgi:hypothetical protein